MPAPSEGQQVLLEMGSRLVGLASQAFPSGTTIDDEDLSVAAEKTAAILKEGKPAVIFNGAFQGGGAEVRCDIILTAPGGELDIFEVKAGTSVKPRHIADVALQVHAIEAGDWKVHNAAILHLNPRYKHDGGKNYPVQKLFKNVDITARVRRQLPRIAETISDFQSSMEDEGTLELPTGTWCKNPLPCHYIDSCISEGPKHPLVSLPQLSKEQETLLHESGIEEIDKMDGEMESLTALQQRAIKSVQENKLIVEKVVPEELQDVDFPLHFVHIQWFLEVLPRFDLSYPWQHIPALWSCHVLTEDGNLEHSQFTFDEAEDPRTKCVESLAKILDDDGTLIVYAGTFEERLRTMLEDFPDLKPKLRSLMHMPLLDLGQLIRHGVYHPDFRGKFDQHTVHSCLSEGGKTPGDRLAEDEAANEALRRIFNSRTRSTTRKKLMGELAQHAESQSSALLDIYRSLRS